MKKKVKRLITLMCTTVAVMSLCGISHAAGLDNYALQAQGRFQYDTDKSGIAGDSPKDVIYDAEDLVIIEQQVKNGKAGLATVLNQYPNTDVASLDTFANFATAIDTINEMPDIYYYDKATEGDSFQRYVLEEGSFYPCDEHGIKTSSIALEGEIRVVDKNDAYIPTEDETQLAKYTSIEQNNLSAGTAGYVDKTFVLGSGGDNKANRVLADATVNINSASYKAGIEFAESTINVNSASYNAGISFADGRINTDSESYRAGIEFADGRVNTNSASYSAGYTAGYTQGVADTQAGMNNATIVYQYHYHDGSPGSNSGCYTAPVYHTHSGSSAGGGCYNTANICNGTIKLYRSGCDIDTYQSKCYYSDHSDIASCGNRRCPQHHCSESYSCSKCGAGYSGTGTCRRTTSYSLSCGKSTSTIETYELACGMNDGQIISATIDFH